MLDKIGPVKNPLTIIAIFAGISEVCGGIVLPFIQQENQLIFIYFLMYFPTLLILLFFLTLNFNHKVLYSPSDYRDEDNFIIVSKFNFSKLSIIKDKVKQSEYFSSLLPEYSEKINSLSNKVENILKNSTINKLPISEESGKMLQELVGIESCSKYKVNVNDLNNAKSLINILNKKGYLVENYCFSSVEENKNNDNLNFKSIWLGKNVPLEIASDVITISKNFYNHLEYIHISEEETNIPNYVHNQIFIGGATSTAEDYSLEPLSKDDFESIKDKDTLVELHKFIKAFYS